MTQAVADILRRAPERVHVQYASPAPAGKPSAVGWSVDHGGMHRRRRAFGMPLHAAAFNRV